MLFKSIIFKINFERFLEIHKNVVFYFSRENIPSVLECENDVVDFPVLVRRVLQNLDPHVRDRHRQSVVETLEFCNFNIFRQFLKYLSALVNGSAERGHSGNLLNFLFNLYETK